MTRRVVITGLGVVSPLGNSPEKLWENLSSGTSGVRPLRSIPADFLPTKIGGEAIDFTGAIEDFGPLEKTMSRNIKKNLKVMCREIQMGVAVAQLALTHGGLKLNELNLDRIGCVYGSDYMLTLPQEFTAGVKACLDENNEFHFDRWADKGLPAVEPLWLLKYLPNLPASHIAIFNDLHGPNNSVTMREASSYLAMGEAYHTITRGHADIIIAGATGTKVHVARTLHVVGQEQMAKDPGDPAKASRPFDLHRSGSVIGEGAGALILEEAESAKARGANVYGEVIGFGATAVVDRNGHGNTKQAVINVLNLALKSAGLKPGDIGHINAHGLGDTRMDADEAAGIAEVFSGSAAKTPVVAAKSYFGNLGAASGLVELVASLTSLREGKLFRTLNYETPDPACPITVNTSDSAAAGDTAISLNITPQGQASAIVVRKAA